ncbi:hypothetical protein [Xanthomonas phage Xp15]|uniref:Uncharacterized protein n=1 Tax=Xanthomonas phage Xp15 TaxID=322855 RepID=Q52PQ7_9CAUD|nr:hypothetical protein XPXV15_gp65 [Xanthomonas phage Xp15]AAX84901.1 hypothetical protein [Xanthomonas phage Xp15]
MDIILYWYLGTTVIAFVLNFAFLYDEYDSCGAVTYGEILAWVLIYIVPVINIILGLWVIIDWAKDKAWPKFAEFLNTQAFTRKPRIKR